MAAVLVSLAVAAPASAQENLDSGKTPAQLFASDCAICHKTPQGLSKPGSTLGGLRGLQGFLREHYTASREAAAAIAAYVQATDRGPPAADRKRTASKPKDKGKPGEGPAAKAKTETKSEAKGSETKPADGKPTGAAGDANAEAVKPAAKSDTKPETAPDSPTKPDGEKKSD